MENKKVEEPRKKAQADTAYTPKGAGQNRHVSDEANKILRELEQKGRQIINEAIKVAEADAAQIVAQAKQEAQQIVEKAKEQVRPDGGGGSPTKEQQISQTVREGNNAVIELQSGDTMNRALDAGFSIIVEATRKAETEANNIVAQAKETGRQIIEEATRKREPEAERIVSQAEEKGRQIIEEATRKADDEANKIVTQALQTGLQIVVEAARIAETGAERTKGISQGETKQLRFIEEAEAATVNRMSRGGNYSNIEQGVHQLTEQTDETAFAEDLVRKAFANSQLKARAVAEEAKTAAALSPLRTLKSIVKPSKEETAHETKAKPVKQTAIYQGQVELAIVPPIDYIQLERLRMSLQRLKNISVLSTEGSNNGKTAISVLLHRPCTLITDLMKIEEVEEALGEENTDSHPLAEVFKKTLPTRPSKRNHHRRILLVLKRTKW